MVHITHLYSPLVLGSLFILTYAYMLTGNGLWELYNENQSHDYSVERHSEALSLQSTQLMQHRTPTYSVNNVKSEQHCTELAQKMYLYDVRLVQPG